MTVAGAPHAIIVVDFVFVEVVVTVVTAGVIVVTIVSVEVLVEVENTIEVVVV